MFNLLVKTAFNIIDYFAAVLFLCYSNIKKQMNALVTKQQEEL